MKDNEPKPEPPKGPARIPVREIWLKEMIDLPGHSIIDHIVCSPQEKPGRRFFLANFVPAHQVIELEVYKNEETEPYRTRIAVAFCKRFD